MTQPARPLGFLDFCRVLGGEQPEPGQLAMCGVCFDGQEPEDVGELAVKIFGYRSGTPAAARDVIGLVAGGRGGKTKWSSRRMLHLGLTVDISALAPGEHGYVFLVAPKLDLAQQALSYIKGDVARRPRLAAMCEVLADEVVIDRGNGQHVTIQIVAAGRGGAGLRGRSLLGALLDETAFFKDETTGVVNDQALFNAIAPRVIAGGQVVVQSTPWARTGLLYDLYRSNYGKPEGALVAHAPTRLLRTDKKILSYVEREYVRDPENARIEFGAEFGSATATQWLDPEALERAVLPAWEPGEPRPGQDVAAGGDLGFARNSSSLVVACREPGGGPVELLLVEERRPEPGQPLRPSEVCREFARRLRSLGLRTLYADRHYAETAREHLDEVGLTLGDPPQLDEAWGLMRQLVRDGQIRLPRHPLLLAQLAGVQGKLQSGGNVSITLAKTPDGRHGDLAAACALAVWALHNRPLVVAAAAPGVGSPAWEAERLRRQEAAIEQRSVAAQARPWWETEGGSLDWAALRRCPLRAGARPRLRDGGAGAFPPGGRRRRRETRPRAPRRSVRRVPGAHRARVTPGRTGPARRGRRRRRRRGARPRRRPALCQRDGGCMTQLADRRWWLQKDKPHEVLCEVVRQVAERNKARDATLLKAARLFGNLPLFGLTPSAAAKAPAKNFGLLSLNIVRALVLTARAALLSPRPRPMFLTSGGDWKARNRAHLQTKWCNGVMASCGFDRLAGKVALHAPLFGDGFVKVHDRGRRVCIDLVYPWELLVDAADAYYGEPRSIYQIRYIDRAVLAALYPEKKREIAELQATSRTMLAFSNRESLADPIEVTEAWHLPSSDDAKDGRHLICCEGATLFSEPWTESRFPFARFAWGDPALGHWCQGIAEEVAGIQLEINRTIQTIQEALYLMAVPRVYVEEGSGVTGAQIVNGIGSLVKYRGRPPQVVVGAAVSPELPAHLDRLWSRAYQLTGISEMAASAMKPAGLTSGRALRIYADQSSGRQVDKSQNFQAFHCDVADLVMRASKRVAARYPDWSVTYHAPGKQIAEKIDWSDVDQDLDGFIIKCEPVSALPEQAAGRLAALEELVNAGAIDTPTFMRLAAFPDLESEQQLGQATYDATLQALEQMTFGSGKAVHPEPFDDLRLCLKIGAQLYARARVDEVPPGRLTLLRNYLVEVQALMAPPPAPPGPPGPPANDLPPPPPGALPPEALPPGPLPPELAEAA